MKRLAFALLLFSVCAFTGCQKDKENDVVNSNGNNQTNNTSLEVSVVNASGQSVSGAAVRLYTSEADWSGDKNVVASKNTDASGKAKFDKLSAVKYYAQVEKTCENNIKGINSTDGVIVTGKTNALTITVQSTGTMVFINKLNNSCDLYINGIFEQNIPAKMQFTLKYVPVGFKSVRMVEKALLLPTDINYTGTLTCGGTLTTTFP